jgi:hypothetical protein
MYVCMCVCTYVCITYLCMYVYAATCSPTVARPTNSIVFRRFVPIMSEITPVPVAARTKLWVCCRSLLAIVGSNPSGGMKVCLFWMVCVVRKRSLWRADHLSRGVLPSVVRRCVWSRNLVNEEALACVGRQRPKKSYKQASECVGSNTTIHLYGIKSTTNPHPEFSFPFLSIWHPVVIVVLILDPESSCSACLFVHTCLCVHTCLYCVCSKVAISTEVWRSRLKCVLNNRGGFYFLTL